MTWAIATSHLFDMGSGELNSQQDRRACRGGRAKGQIDPVGAVLFDGEEP